MHLWAVLKIFSEQLAAGPWFSDGGSILGHLAYDEKVLKVQLSGLLLPV